MDQGDDRASDGGARDGGKAARGSRQRSARPGVAPIGDALRGVYETTVEESVPQEMLDLLGKLG